jgi:hypothetical protein
MSALQTAVMLHVFDTRGTWDFKINKNGRKVWLSIPYGPAIMWMVHAAKRMRDDYRSTCEGKPTLEGYRAYLRRECWRDIARDPGLLPWFNDLTADTWKRRRWSNSGSAA